MMPSQRQQLRALDRAILALVDERARLIASTSGHVRPATDDLLRRYAGPLAGPSVRALFEAVDRASGARTEVQS